MRAMFVYFLLISTSFAQPPAKIDGPQSAKVGELIELKATVEIGQMEWGMVQNVPYKTYPLVRKEGDRLFETGTAIVFSAPVAGRYEVVLFTAIATNEGKILLSSQRTSVEVTGEGPGPIPPPGPGPTPPEPEPTPSFPSLTEIAKKTAPAEKRAEMRLVFRSMASAVGAGTINDWATLITKTAAGTREAVGDPDVANHPWQDFSYAIGEELDRLEDAGKFKTRISWREAWNAIAEGLQ